MTTPTSTLMNKGPIVALFLLLLIACGPPRKQEYTPAQLPVNTPYLIVLGVAQDAGYPQTGQQKEWALVKSGEREIARVVSLGLVDPSTQQRWLFEATPDFNIQLAKMDEFSEAQTYPYDGIFLTHAHMGHYTGLMHIGYESMNAQNVPVYAMPRMKEFLSTNGPWDQLVTYNNIQFVDLKDGEAVVLNDRIQVTPLQVPHRDEYSETVGFVIHCDSKKVLFIPDIDKWNKWDTDIRELIKSVDVALVDATFYDNKELPGRDMSKIPHPFVVESMELFKGFSDEDKAKVHFIHLNHTNPLLVSSSPEHQEVLRRGFKVARSGQVFKF